MAYDNDVRPERTTIYYDRPSEASSYVLPVLALLAMLGLGLFFFSTRDNAPAPVTPTIERTTPAPAIPAPTIPAPAPTVPK